MSTEIPAPDGSPVPETSQDLQRALGGDHAATRALLASFARGEFGIDAREWLRAVSARLLDADTGAALDHRRRPDAIVKALGLTGRGDQDRQLLDLVEGLDGLVEPGERWTADQLIVVAQHHGLITGGAGHPESRQKIKNTRDLIRDRLRKGQSPPSG